MTEQKLVKHFSDLFSGYEEAYGTYDASQLGASNGKQKLKQWSERRPVTEMVFRKHLEGVAPLGVYLLNKDERVSFAAIDIDIYPLDHKAISRQLMDWSIPVLVCNSKSNGAHLYVFFEEPECPSRVVNSLKLISSALGYRNAEIFPKQTRRHNGQLGNYINLPFFGSPKIEYSCFHGEKNLGLPEFVDFASRSKTTIDMLEESIRTAGLDRKESITTEQIKPQLGGRNSFLFNFGLQLKGLGLEDSQIASAVRERNQAADANDHPNFGSEGPLPAEEIEIILQSLQQMLLNDDKDKILNIVEKINTSHAHIMIGGKARIMNISFDPNTGWEAYDFSTAADFRSLYSNQKVVAKGKRQTIADVWLAHPERRSYSGITFHPSRNVDGYFNLFQGFPILPIRGSCSLYLQHIQDNICCADSDLYAYILNWMADAIQNPSVRPGVALAIRGKQGVGKGVFVSNFARLFGPHYIQVTQSAHLVGNFNAHLKDRLLVFADEAFWAGDKRAEGVLKGLITESQLAIELKGVDIQSIPNHVRLIMASNNDWLVPASADQRRFVVLEAGSAKIQDSRYFAAIAEEMNNGGSEALMDFLLNRDLEGVDLRQIPRTQALAEQQLRSLGSVGQWLYSCLDFGGIEEPESSGETYLREWPEEYEIKKMFNAYAIFCKRSGLSHPERVTTFGKTLKELMPALVKRREGGKTRKSIYLLPNLEQAREEFEQANKLHSIDWARDDGKLV